MIFFPAGVVFLLIAVTVAFFALATLNAWESKRGKKDCMYYLQKAFIESRPVVSILLRDLVVEVTSRVLVDNQQSRQREHGWCDQSAEDVHFSMAPDLTSYYFNFLFAPALYFYLWSFDV